MSYQLELDHWFCFTVLSVRDGVANLSGHGWEDLIIDGERVSMRPLATADRSVKALKLMRPGHVYRLKYTLRGDIERWEHDLIIQEDAPADLRPHSYVEILASEMGLLLEQNADALAAAVDAVLAMNPPGVADYKAGKKAALNSLLGLCMKQSKGLDAKKVRERLVEVLGN